METKDHRDVTHDLVLPTLLFAVLGGMTWAVRGCSGYGAAAGCIFAGVTWGAAWWYLARAPGGFQPRRYASGWIVLALTVGIGYSGARGWMQWPSFFDGKLMTHYTQGEYVPISWGYGFLWLFIAGVPWAGLGACVLAWSAPVRRTGVWHWVLRFVCGIGMAIVAVRLFNLFPQVFLPLYSSISDRYQDLEANPNLRRLMGDNRLAILHLGLYLGFLLYEIIRRDWKNVQLILIVGLANGAGWALLQNWKWAAGFWPGANFNWWRCWESSGGISIGIAYGLAYYWVNGRDSAKTVRREMNIRPNLERFGLYFGLLLGLGLSIRNGLKGWANIYLGNEDYWSRLLWMGFGPLMLVLLVVLIVWIRRNPLPGGYTGDLFPNAYGLLWGVLIVQNILAQLVTGPISQWNEVAFSIYYVLLFLISAVIVVHYRYVKSSERIEAGS